MFSNFWNWFLQDLKMMDVFELFIVFVFENKENENTTKQVTTVLLQVYCAFKSYRMSIQ